MAKNPKLISLLNKKKFNPRKYLGVDADVKQLIRALKYHDENQNVYQFSPLNLANNWIETTYKWQSLNTSIKYDYIIANFSIMHFFTEEFWSQLNEINFLSRNIYMFILLEIVLTVVIAISARSLRDIHICRYLYTETQWT